MNALLGSSQRTMRALCWLGAAVLTIGVANADIVTEWNELTMLALRTESAGPVAGSRSPAIVHAAIYDGVNSILRTHEPYRFDTPPCVPDASPEAAALAAAHHTLTVLYPSKRGVFNAAYTNKLATLPDGAGREEGLRIGREIARLMIELRHADGSATQVPYIPSDAPGAWRRTAPDFRPPVAPHWGSVTPFVIPSATCFPVPPPPSLGSSNYAAAFAMVKELGARTNSIRTDDETEIGLFWAYDRSRLGPATILYNRILQIVAAQQGNTFAENARLFALANLAQADAGIVCWRAKYAYNFWRPNTAIRAAHNDGNAETTADSGWEPLGCPGANVQADFTPPFPSYPSGHSMFGSAMFQILRRFYGCDGIAFSATSEELPGQSRHFKAFSEADEENAISRVYLGVHWIFDQRVGQTNGWQIADYIFDHALRPCKTALRPDPSFTTSRPGRECSFLAAVPRPRPSNRKWARSFSCRAAPGR